MFYSAFGKILTLTLEAYDFLCLILLIRPMHDSFNSSISPLGEFSTLWFLRANRFVSNSLWRVYLQTGLFYSLIILKVQRSKLFICMLSSQAFDLGVGESLRFWEKKLIIRTRREIRVQISRLIAKSKMWISISKSGFPNQAQP